jgi:hypothetical protein
VAIVRPPSRELVKSDDTPARSRSQCRWDELERAAEPFPEAYAVHHWTLSWWAEQGVG